MQAPPPDMVPGDADPDGFQEMELLGVRVEMPSNSPIALLKEAHGDRYLSVWIGAVEATAIAFAHQGKATVRPLTHELFCDFLDAADVRIVRVRITSLVDSIFYGDLVLSNGSTVESRPSDVIALAIRAGAPILVADELLAEVGVAVPDDRSGWQASDPAAEKVRQAIDPGTGKAPQADGPGTAKAEPARESEPSSVVSQHPLGLTVHDSPTAALVELEVVGVRVEMPSNSPIVLLKEVDRARYLPIWIGAVEATAIAFAQQGMVSLRPLTHDLFRDVIEAVGVRLLSVRINALSAGIFYSDLVLSNGSTVSARPSDAVALALRTGAKIEATTEMLDAVGVDLPGEEVVSFPEDGQE